MAGDWALNASISSVVLNCRKLSSTPQRRPKKVFAFGGPRLNIAPE
jgi:hypothetical protein